MRISKNHKKDWTTKEINYLKENHKQMTIKEIAKSLNRSYKSITNKMFTLKLKPTHKRELLDYAYYDGDTLVCMGRIDEIEKFTGISRTNLFLYRHPSYKKRLKRELIEVS